MPGVIEYLGPLDSDATVISHLRRTHVESFVFHVPLDDKSKAWRAFCATWIWTASSVRAIAGGPEAVDHYAQQLADFATWAKAHRHQLTGGLLHHLPCSVAGIILAYDPEDDVPAHLLEEIAGNLRRVHAPHGPRQRAPDELHDRAGPGGHGLRRRHRPPPDDPLDRQRAQGRG